MAKSKALRKERQPGGDDFSLQSKRRLSQRAVRVSSRSCSPEQSPSPSHNKHHSKVTLADFVNLSSESRVLSSQRGIAMASLNLRLHRLAQPILFAILTSKGRDEGKLSVSMLPLPLPRATSPTGVVTGISSTLVHFPDVSVAAACSIKDADVQDPVDKWKHCLVGYVAGKFPGMVGKPIHCDSPTAQMSRISYARVLIDIDLFTELKTSVNVMLPNGTLLVQNLNKEEAACSINLRNQLRFLCRYCCCRETISLLSGPSCIYREDPMSSEVAVMDLQPSSSQPPNCKRTKAGKAEMAPLPACPCCLLVLMLIVMGQLCGFSFAFVTGLCLLRMSLLVLAGVGLLLYAVLIGYQSLTRLGLVLLLFRQTAMVYSWLSMMTGAAWLLDGFVLRM
ncbi:hypothetical protein NC652_034165 [Populus alba x Populus x berolinensis]|nr:hypothetical protein NC652_034165 [Populus alba x Populus x berolinensis]